MTTAPKYVEGHNLLRGKSVLVTAAAGAGIGFSAALRAAEEGCRALMISDIHPRRLDEAVANIKAQTGLQQVFGQLCDVSQEEQVQVLINAAEDKLAGVDVLINNAGLGGQTAVVDMSDEQWSKVMDITLTGTFRMTRAMLPFMQQRKAGVIINNAQYWAAYSGDGEHRFRFYREHLNSTHWVHDIFNLSVHDGQF